MKQKHLWKVDKMPTVDEFKSTKWTDRKPYVGLVGDKKGGVFYNYDPIKLPDTPETKLPDGYVWAKDDDFEWVGGTQTGYWHYKGTDDKVAIPHVIKDKKVTSYKSMFDGTRVSGVYSDNLMVTNMSFMFGGSQATSLDLTYLDTSSVTDMRNMFFNSQVKTLDLSKFNTSNVTDMGGMFQSSETTSLDLSNFDTRKVTNMSLMFRKSKATSLVLSNFDTGKVTDMNGMFYESKAISLNLSNFNTSNVTDMGNMFRASQATSLNLSKFKTSKVTDMSYMFYNSKVTEIDLSSFDTSNVTKMNYMFYNSKVNTLDLSSFNTSNVKYMNDMFSNAQSTEGYARTQVDADNLNDSLNKPSGLIFRIKIPKGYVWAKDLDFKWVGGQENGYWQYTGKPEKVAIPHTIKDHKVTSYKNMFAHTKVSGVYTVNPDIKNMSNMFYGSFAKDLDLSNFNTSGVIDMSGMFMDSQATSLDLSSFDTSNVTDMSGMFMKSQANTLDLLKFDTRKVKKMSVMFASSVAQLLDLSSFDTSNATKMDDMFQGAQVKEGYAKTQKDADRFNSSFGGGLAPTPIFKVKQ